MCVGGVAGGSPFLGDDVGVTSPEPSSDDVRARPSRNRFPRSVYSVGSEPDPRFSLANERTFLAWIQTSIGLIAAGVALEALAVPIHPGLRGAASVLLIVAGSVLPAQAWWGWMRSERAMRLSEPLPSPRLAGPLALVIVVTGVLVLVGTVVGR